MFYIFRPCVCVLMLSRYTRQRKLYMLENPAYCGAMSCLSFFLREEQVESEVQGLGRQPAHAVGMSGSGSVRQAGIGTHVVWGLAPCAHSLGLAHLRVVPGLRTPVTRSASEGHGEDRPQDLKTWLAHV